MLVFTGHAVRWLTFLKRLQLPPVAHRPYADYVDQWADYRLRERGLSPRTVKLDQASVLDQVPQVFDGIFPERAGSPLAAFAEQLHLEGRIQG